MRPFDSEFIGATWHDGQVQLEGAVDWPEGTRLMIVPVVPLGGLCCLDGHVVVVGFGLAGRCVADLLDAAHVAYTIVEKNPVTVETQRALGRRIIQGDATEMQTLLNADLANAEILALTIPDEEAVLLSIAVARRMKPELYIIARTNYSSKGMRASQLGADDVVKAEQAVALQFYDKLSYRLRQLSQAPAERA